VAYAKISKGGPKRPLPKFLENVAILCFERRFSKQNSVNRLKLNILVYTAEYCLYIFLFFESEGGAVAQWSPPPYASEYTYCIKQFTRRDFAEIHLHSASALQEYHQALVPCSRAAYEEVMSRSDFRV